MPSSEGLRRRLTAMADSIVPPTEVAAELDVLDDIARREPSPVTIGIAMADDYEGAFFTLAALSLSHPEVIENAEILLLDNHPDGLQAQWVRAALPGFPRVTYVPVRSVRSTAVRDLLFRLATGEVVIVLDSHVLVRPGGLAAVVDHLSDPGCRDLVQGPLLSGDGGVVRATHMDPVWRTGMYGAWGTDERILHGDGAPVEIPLHGLGAFAARRDMWPGLNPHFTGFGGEEGYLHEKFRRSGGRTVCLPAFGWVHRFGHPRGLTYDVSWESRARNYTIGWSELGMDVDGMRDHFTGYVGPVIADHIDRVRAGLHHPLWQYDGIVVLNDDVQPGRWRRALELLGSVSLIPRRLPRPVVVDGVDPATSALEAGQRYARYWGWRDYAVVDDAALLAAGDADGVHALLQESSGPGHVVHRSTPAPGGAATGQQRPAPAHRTSPIPLKVPR